MKKYKYVILGAGPAGLSFANRLIANGEEDFIILERFDEAGGLCRSKNVDGAPLDTGGGHFLDIKRKNVLDFLFGFMGEEEWNLFRRDSQIQLEKNTIHSPIEANIWQLPLADQVEYLKTIAIAGCNLNEPIPKKFTDWIYWKLGSKIAADYMIPYNKKMFGENLNILGTYWLDKLPNVSFDETLISCIEKHAYGQQPAHAQFFYPKKYGFGELWNRMAVHIEEKIIYNYNVNEIDIENRIVNGQYQGEFVISTIPWTSVAEFGARYERIRELSNELKYSSVVVSYCQDDLSTDAHWIYCPNPNLSYHRILVRTNFCTNSKGYWTETNLNRFDTKSDAEYFVNDYAYPLNTIGKQEIIGEILDIASKHNVFGLGRWGEWQHYNSDVVVERAINLADGLSKKR